MVSQRIAHASQDLEEWLIEKFKNKFFSIQIVDVTYCSDVGQLIAYVRYVEDTTIKEDMLFCKPVKKKSSSKRTLQNC
jgi:hypothetical protein